MGTGSKAIVLIGACACAWGSAHAGNLVVTPNPHNFAEVSVSAPPAVTFLELANTGSETQVDGFVLGDGCDEFTANAAIPLPVFLSNGASLIVNVTYDPANRGFDECQVTTQSSGTGGTFTLQGTGIAPVLDTMPASLQFAAQRWNGGDAQTLNITITNNGEEMIAAHNLSVTLATGVHFSTEAAVGLPIASGESALIPVTFDPVSAGAKADTVTVAINNDPPANPNDSVSLRGVGTQSIQTFSAASLNIGAFEVGSGGTADMEIGNSGDATLNIDSVSLSGPHAQDFSFQDHGCAGQGPCMPAPSQIGAGSPAEQFSLRCEPSAEGPRTAFLDVASDDPDSPRSASLECMGLRPADVIVSDSFEN